MEIKENISGIRFETLNPIQWGRVPVLLRFLVIFLLFSTVFATPLVAAESRVTGKANLEGSQTDSFDKDFAEAFDRDFLGPNGHQEKLIPDPLEGWNRGVFWFNDKLYFYLVKPVARGYRYTVPKPARTSVKNFFSNLAAPIRVANALLQFKFKDFGNELYRFIVNSTLGIGGLFDPADSIAGIKRRDKDFGLTMGYYGIGHGFYLVLPIVGPSSLRDATGSVVDSFFDPAKYADLGTVEYLGVQTFKTINWLSLDPDTYEGVIRDALDPYLFIRAAYVQRRMAMVGRSDYTVDMLNIFDGTDFDFDIVNPLRWLGI